MLDKDKIKNFVEKHRGKIIAGVVTATGIIIAYNCGTHEVIARLKGNAFETLITPDHNWANHVHKFLEASVDNPKEYMHEIDIPKDQLVEIITDYKDAIPEDYKTFNILMIAAKK